MNTKQKIILIHKIAFLLFIMLSCLLNTSFAAESSNISRNSGIQDKAGNTIEISANVLNNIIANLKEQESLLKNNVVLSYTMTIKPPEVLLENTGQAGISYERHEVTAMFSSSKIWEQSTRFGVDGKKTLQESFSWDGTSGKRLIISESTGVKKGWNNYNPASARSNPTSTQNLLLIFGFLGTQEQSLSQFIANHHNEIEISQRDSEIFLKFSVLNDMLDYSVVLDSDHSFWPKHITQIYRNAKEDGIDLGDIRFEYRDIEFGQTNVGNSVAYYPKKMKYYSYLNSEMLGSDNIESSSESVPAVINEISINSIDFNQAIGDEKIQLDFPEDTVVY